jgi:response regulator of citrate/malate metabolism
MKLNCLIVDDEPLAIKVLERHIANIPSLSIIGTAVNAFTAIDILKQGKTDLMFLDIHMPKLLGTRVFTNLANATKSNFYNGV